MSFLRASIAAAAASNVSDPNTSTKKRVRVLARHVQLELEKVFEDMSEVLGERPYTPIVFVRAFNELKSQLSAINHDDKFLHMMQHMARCSLLSEFGPAEDEYSEFPKCLENGLLEVEEQSLEDEIETFVNDVSLYATAYGAQLTGMIPPLPISYHISMEGYRKMAKECATAKKLVDEIPDLIMKYFKEEFEDTIVEENFMQKCNDQYKELVDSFNT